MRPSEVEIRFFDTYYFSNVIKNVLAEPLAYIRHLHDFYGDGREVHFSKPFPRFSVLHSFLEFVISDLLTETGDVDLDIRQDRLANFSKSMSAMGGNPTVLPLNEALQYYGIGHTSFVEWLSKSGKVFDEADRNDVDEYYSELSQQGAVSPLLDKCVDETFYVLFPNRRLLLSFNSMMSRQINDIDLDEVPSEYLDYFERSGVLRRAGVPAWAKDAVFYRDRGRCVLCRCDMSGLLSVGSDKNFDHMVPLALGGLNDVTNLQLLCDKCNLRKSKGEAVTSDFYQAWYDLNPRF